jgi:hypothetical protein
MSALPRIATAKADMEENRQANAFFTFDARAAAT